MSKRDLFQKLMSNPNQPVRVVEVIEGQLYIVSSQPVVGIAASRKIAEDINELFVKPLMAATERPAQSAPEKVICDQPKRKRGRPRKIKVEVKLTSGTTPAPELRGDCPKGWPVNGAGILTPTGQAKVAEKAEQAKLEFETKQPKLTEGQKILRGNEGSAMVIDTTRSNPNVSGSISGLKESLLKFKTANGNPIPDSVIDEIIDLAILGAASGMDYESFQMLIETGLMAYIINN